MYPKVINDVIENLRKLPGIGEKTAERLALFLASEQTSDDLIEFSESIRKLANNIKFCQICHLISEEDICNICANDLRDRNQIMVVSDSKDVFAMNRTNTYLGMFHVLGGLIDFSRGKTEKDINVNTLIERVNENTEIIIATNSTVEGELTAQYLKTILLEKTNKITRLAYGLPVGTDLKYADDKTLAQAIINRIKY